MKRESATRAAHGPRPNTKLCLLHSIRASLYEILVGFKCIIISDARALLECGQAFHLQQRDRWTTVLHLMRHSQTSDALLKTAENL